MSVEAYAEQAYAVVHQRGSDHLAVLLHGLGGDSNQPLGLTTDQLAGTGVDVLAPDARAHGRTPVIGPPERFTTDALAEDVLALIDRLGLGDRRLIPIGISMGAAVALRIAERVPERLAGVLLIRPAFGPTPWPEHAASFPVIADLLRRFGPEGADHYRETDEYRAVAAVSASGAASLVEQFTKPDALARVVRLETVPGNTAVAWEGARDLGVPVAVIGAPDDPVHPLAMAELWQRRLAGATLDLVPGRDADPTGYAVALDTLVRDRVIAWSSRGSDAPA